VPRVLVHAALGEDVHPRVRARGVRAGRRVGVGARRRVAVGRQVCGRGGRPVRVRGRGRGEGPAREEADGLRDRGLVGSAVGGVCGAVGREGLAEREEGG
jgi:hypothetical protein